jgi:hypothetical protein
MAGDKTHVRALGLSTRASNVLYWALIDRGLEPTLGDAVKLGLSPYRRQRGVGPKTYSEIDAMLSQHRQVEPVTITQELERFARALLMHHKAKNKRPEDIYCTLASILIEQDVEKARETLIALDKRLSEGKSKA